MKNKYLSPATEILRLEGSQPLAQSPVVVIASSIADYQGLNSKEDDWTE